MAKSIGKSILSDTSKHNKPGGRAKGNMSISTRKVGNKGSFGAKKNSRQIKSINTGGNYGTLGY